MDQEEIKIELAFAKSEQDRRDSDNRRREGWLAQLRAERIPELASLTDHGLSFLSPAMNAICERACTENGLDYDKVREDFETRVQVIRSREDSPLKKALIDKCVIPANELDHAFHGWVTGAVSIAYRRRLEAYEQIRKHHAVQSMSAPRQTQ